MRKIFTFLILCFLCLSFLPLTQAQSCLATRLEVGGQAIVTPGSSNRVRSQPSTSAEQVGQIPAGGVFTLLEGPRCVDGFLWWRVDYNGVTGWTVEANSDTYFVDPVSEDASAGGSDGSTCSLAARLRVNGLGRTASNTPVRIRSAAGSSNSQIGQVDPADTFSVLAGPVCVEGLNWWQIRVGDTTGWIAEGSGSDYFVELIANTATPTASRTPFPTSVPTNTRTPTVTFTPTFTLTASVTPTQTPSGFAEAYDLSWNADGTRLALASSEGVFIYDASDWNAYPSRLEECQNSMDVEYSPTDPNLIVMSCYDTTIPHWQAVLYGESENVYMFEVIYQEELKDSTEHFQMSPARGFSFSADGSRFAFADNEMYIYDTTAEDGWTILYHSGPIAEGSIASGAIFVGTFALSPDGLWALPFTAVGVPYLFRTDGTEYAFLDRNIRTQPITAAAFSPDSQLVIVGDDTGSLQMWHIATQERTSFIRDEDGVSQSNYINAIAFHPDSLELATAESNPQGIVRIFRADTLEQLENYGLNGGYSQAVDLAYSPDGEILAVIMDNYIHLLETEDYTLIQTLVQRP